MGEGFNVDPEELKQAAGRLSAVVKDIRSGEMARTALGVDFGHSGAQKAYTDFCAGLDKGVKVMADLIDSMGDSLRHTADSYVRQDDAGRADVNRTGAGGRG